MTSKYLLLGILLPILGMVGCASLPHTKIDIPARPHLTPVSQEIWQQVPSDAQLIWLENDLSLKQYVRLLESRIMLHNELYEDE